MGWKNWSYWLKGGVIGILMGFFTFLFLLNNEEYPSFLLPARIVWHYICNLSGSSICFFSVALSIITYYFLLGALICYIYGKIKNKN